MTAMANHLWQSSLFAAFAWLLTLALHRNGARLRHAVWLAASCKFLIPFSMLVALGGHVRLRSAPEVPIPAAMVTISQPFTAQPVLPAAAAPTSIPIESILFAIWASGFLALTTAWLVRWRRLRAAVRDGVLLEPGVFGIFRPVLWLPAGIADTLTASQLAAVIAHEHCHIRHRDNLAAALHMFVESVFWFHPLVWWMGRRMVAERELACDEEVLQLGAPKLAYAEGILQICKLYVESPLAFVSGVTGANLQKRIEAIMSHRATAQLTRWRKAALAFAAAAALAAPIVIGILHAPPMLAQSASAPRPKFEVISIKPCQPGEVPPGGGRQGGRGGGAVMTSDPGLLHMPCTTADRLIRSAYIRFATPKSDEEIFTSSQRIVNQNIGGEPAWAESERYTIDAKPETPQTAGMMRGPMLQTLLEDRFQLKIHRDDKEMPVYALVVGKGGSKLTPTREGSCRSIEQFDPTVPPKPGDLPVCGPFGPDKAGGIVTHGSTLASLCAQFSVALDRDVVDRTGLTGKFDIHLDLTNEELFPWEAASPDPTDSTSAIMAAVQKLGLRLEPASASAEHLVIDRIEKPSAN